MGFLEPKFKADHKQSKPGNMPSTFEAYNSTLLISNYNSKCISLMTLINHHSKVPVYG